MKLGKKMVGKLALFLLLGAVAACGPGEEKKEGKEVPAVTPAAAVPEPPPPSAPEVEKAAETVAVPAPAPAANQETDLPGVTPPEKAVLAPPAPPPAVVEPAPKNASPEAGVESLETPHPAAKAKEPVGPLRSALPPEPKMERRSDRLKAALPKP